VVVHRCPHSIQSRIEALTAGAVYTSIIALCITFIAVRLCAPALRPLYVWCCLVSREVLIVNNALLFEQASACVSDLMKAPCMKRRTSSACSRAPSRENRKSYRREKMSWRQTQTQGRSENL
jgi:hypothetical protein